MSFLKSFQICNWCNLSLSVIFSVFVVDANAGISLDATRVILGSDKKDASLVVRNQSDRESMVQSWIDTDSKDEVSPFAVTPPLARLRPNGRQQLRVIFQGSGMPNDRESVLWMNVQEIPQALKSSNHLQIAVRQKIKVFFRPVGLPGRAAEAPQLVKWSIAQEKKNYRLRFNNPTPFNINIASLMIRQQGNDTELFDGGRMVTPFENSSLLLPDSISGLQSKLVIKTVNDFGGLDEHLVELSPAVDLKE